MATLKRTPKQKMTTYKCTTTKSGQSSVKIGDSATNTTSALPMHSILRAWAIRVPTLTGSRSCCTILTKVDPGVIAIWSNVRCWRVFKTLQRDKWRGRSLRGGGSLRKAMRISWGIGTLSILPPMVPLIYLLSHLRYNSPLRKIHQPYHNDHRALICALETMDSYVNTNVHSYNQQDFKVCAEEFAYNQSMTIFFPWQTIQTHLY